MRINNNIMAMNTHRQLGINSNAGSKSVEKLSSGFRINRAGDDAAGLAISEKMRGQIRGLDQASRNAQDGISLIQTAEGALNETHAILQRMRELSVQAANGTSTNADKANIQEEVNQLISEVDRIASDTEFNTKKLLNGDMSQTAKFATVTNVSAGISSVAVASNATTGNALVTVRAAGAGTASTIGGPTAAVWGTNRVQSGTTASTLLTGLNNFAGTSTGLVVGDEITLSAVVGGEVKNSVFVVQADSDLDNLMAHIKNTMGANTVSVSVSGAVSGNGGAGYDIVSGASGLDIGNGAAVGRRIQIVGETGATKEISSLSITAVSSEGIAKTTFNQLFNQGANSGLNQFQVAANNGDSALYIDADGGAAVNKGDSVIATRANAIVQASNMTITMSATTPTAAGTATVTVGSNDQSASIQIGANQGQTTDISVNSMDSTSLGLKTNGVNLSVMTNQAASTTITKVNDAISVVSEQRAKLGAIQNRLEHTIKNLDTSQENLQASESRIRDVDMAKEMMTFTKNNILQQAAQAMLAQANQAPQGVLQLLR